MKNLLNALVISLSLLTTIANAQQSISKPAVEQEYLNLDFETVVPGTRRPSQWSIPPKGGYFTSPDSLEKLSGKNSMSIAYIDAEKGFGVFTQGISAEPFKGKKVKFTGFIRSEDIKEGYAGLWLRVDGSNGMLAIDNMGDRGVKGTSDWAEYTIEMTVKEEARYIIFGGLNTGKGKAWFDNFSIYIDGEKYGHIAPVVKEPTPHELAWLKSAIIPLKGFDATADTRDLKPLIKAIGKASVVALGEVSHGSSEIFKMKHRLIRALNEEAGFKTFSIEANMPESYKLNTYIQQGQGDPQSLVKGMIFWTWATTEVLDMVNWMKDANQSKNAGISFTGFDMQSFKGPFNEAAEIALETSKDAAANPLRELETQLKAVADKRTKGQGYVRSSSEEEAKFKASWEGVAAFAPGITDPKKKAWFLQNLELLKQYAGNLTPISRDQHMATNLLWIRNQNPENKIIIWAHNGHIMKTGTSMGKHLADKLGKEYLTVGFAFHEGEYTAMGPSGLRSYPAQTSYPGSYEYFFQSIKEPVFAIDLRNIPANNPAAKWLRDQMLFRRVGAVKTDHEFSKTDLTKDFDILIFIDKSTHSKLLKGN